MSIRNIIFIALLLLVCIPASAIDLKGAMHLHTTISDGQQTPSEIAKAYRAHGYDFLIVTDHNHHTACHYPGMIVIRGQEIVENGWHILEFDGLRILAHPIYQHFYNQLDYRNLTGIDGVEYYNAWGDLDSRIVADYFKAKNSSTILLPGEDCHDCNAGDDLYGPRCFRTAIHVNVEKADEEDILEALKDGRYWCEPSENFAQAVEDWPPKVQSC